MVELGPVVLVVVSVQVVGLDLVWMLGWAVLVVGVLVLGWALLAFDLVMLLCSVVRAAALVR